MKRRSFFLKLFLGNLLLVAIVLPVIFAVSYTFLNTEYRQRERESQSQLARTVQLYFQRVWPASVAEIDRHCKRLARGTPTRITVIEADGRVLGDSETDPLTMVNHLTADRPEVLAAMSDEPGWDVRTSETLNRDFRYHARPIRVRVGDGEVVGAVRLARPVQTIVAGRSFLWHALSWGILAAVGVAVALGLLISWIWARPLLHVTRTARKLASGDLTARATISGPAELAQLARALNEMRESISRQIELIDSQRRDLQTAVANLREGVVALDGGRHVVLINDAARQMLGADDRQAVGRHVQQAVRIGKVLDALEEVTEENPVTRQIEVESHGRRLVLDLHVSLVGPQRPGAIAALIVVRDVTQLARAAAMKAEFVANASHELRTPLATIRAAVDSLSSMEDDDREAVARFVDILNRQVRRLEEMTKDLLDLHIVEQARRELKLEPIELGSLGAWMRSHYEPQAAERRIKLSVTAEPEDHSFVCDRTLVQLIAQNLVDNALKFTDADGEVNVRLAPTDDGRVEMRVADTGCGIPADLQPRVFERFFQAEPSRTGAEGRGTGLGLAIVKYAAERMGAELSLESRAGEGTTVTVRMPSHGR